MQSHGLLERFNRAHKNLMKKDMPPVHPAIVHFPIALVTLWVLADFFGYIYSSMTLQAAGCWSLFGAAISAALAILAGLFDMSRAKIEDEAHKRVHTHMKVGFILFAAIAGLTLWRWLIYSDVANKPGRGYLVAAFIVLVLTFFQGWLGGELVFSDGVGVAPTGKGPEPPNKAKERASKIAGDDSEGKEQTSHA